MRGIALLRALAVAAIVSGLPIDASAQHEDLSIYSTANGGGALELDPEPGENPVFENGSLCFPSACLYSTTDPGFITPTGDDGSLFALDAGTEVSLEIVAIDAAVTVKVGAVRLEDPGDSVALGTASSLHVHPEYQVVVPQGTSGDFPVSFRLNATAGASYASSTVYEMTLRIEGGSATPTPTPTPTASASPTATPTAQPTATSGATATPRPSATPTPQPSAGPTPTSALTPTPSPAGTATPRPSGAPTPSPTAAPTPTGLATPSATPAPSSTPSPSAPAPTATMATPSPTPSPEPTVGNLPGLVLERPSARGDQVVFVYDARADAATFLNVANVSSSMLDVELLLYGPELAAPFVTAATIAGGGTHVFDVAALRTAGLPEQLGFAFATAVDSQGRPIVTRALAGNFTIADVATSAAWGDAGAARAARLVQGSDVSVPPLGTVIDGGEVVFERFSADALELSVYYDPLSVTTMPNGRSDLVFVSFDDVVRVPFEATRGDVSWNLAATRSDGTALPGDSHDAVGVEIASLPALLGAGADGSSGRLELTTSGPAANRLVWVVQSLGPFGAGYLLPPLGEEK